MGLAANRQTRAVPNWLLVYGSVVVAAEIGLALVGMPVAAAIHASLLVVLAGHNAFSSVPKDPQIPALMVLPLIRILSLVMPVGGLDPLAAYALVGAPALLGAIGIARALGFDARSLGLGMPSQPWVTAGVAASGIPLGLVLGGTMGPSLAIDGEPNLVMFVLVVPLFVVLLEELTFRGLLQHVALVRAPNLGILIPNVLYAAMYLASGSGAIAIAMGGTGILLGAATWRTGSLWGALGAHLLMRLVIQYDPGI